MSRALRPAGRLPTTKATIRRLSRYTNRTIALSFRLALPRKDQEGVLKSKKVGKNRFRPDLSHTVQVQPSRRGALLRESHLYLNTTGMYS